MNVRRRSIAILVAMTVFSGVLGVSAVAKDEWDVAIACVVAVAVCAVITFNYARIGRR